MCVALCCAGIGTYMFTPWHMWLSSSALALSPILFPRMYAEILCSFACTLADVLGVLEVTIISGLENDVGLRFNITRSAAPKYKRKLKEIKEALGKRHNLNTSTLRVYVLTKTCIYLCKPNFCCSCKHARATVTVLSREEIEYLW